MTSYVAIQVGGSETLVALGRYRRGKTRQIALPAEAWTCGDACVSISPLNDGTCTVIGVSEGYANVRAAWVDAQGKPKQAEFVIRVDPIADIYLPADGLVDVVIDVR